LGSQLRDNDTIRAFSHLLAVYYNNKHAYAPTAHLPAIYSPGVSAVLDHALRLRVRGGAELERADVKGFPIQRADRVRTRAGAYVRGQMQWDLGSALRTRVYGPDLLAYVQT
jgi:hypothetical protein